MAGLCYIGSTQPDTPSPDTTTIIGVVSPGDSTGGSHAFRVGKLSVLGLRNLTLSGMRARNTPGIVASSVFFADFVEIQGFQQEGAIIASEGTVQLSRSRLVGNQAPNGGAISCRKSYVTLNEVGFRYNYATAAGGAIHAELGCLVNITGSNSSFVGNSAPVGGAISIKGGQVAVDAAVRAQYNRNTTSLQGGFASIENDAYSGKPGVLQFTDRGAASMLSDNTDSVISLSEGSGGDRANRVLCGDSSSLPSWQPAEYSITGHACACDTQFVTGTATTCDGSSSSSSCALPGVDDVGVGVGAASAAVSSV